MANGPLTYEQLVAALEKLRRSPTEVELAARVRMDAYWGDAFEAARLSEPSLRCVWDNPEDARYDEEE